MSSALTKGAAARTSLAACSPRWLVGLLHCTGEPGASPPMPMAPVGPRVTVRRGCLNRCRGATLDAVCFFSCFDRLLRTLLQLPLVRLDPVRSAPQYHRSRATGGLVAARSSVDVGLQFIGRCEAAWCWGSTLPRFSGQPTTACSTESSPRAPEQCP